MAVTMAELNAGALTTSWNYCGEKMAVGSVDGFVEMWEKRDDGSLAFIYKWKAHNQRVLKIAWGPPEYGDIVASCSTDGTVALWEEVEENRECNWRQCALIDRSVSKHALDLQFGNCLNGLKLVVAGSDGHVSIYECTDGLELKLWQLQATFPNLTDVTEKIGKCSCSSASISWRPPIGAIQKPTFALGYCTKSTKFSSPKIWEFSETNQRWYAVAELVDDDDVSHDGDDEEEDGLKSISWAPNIGRSYELVAVAVGSTVNIWHVNSSNALAKRVAKLMEHNGEVFQVEWDTSGMTLASSGSDGVVRIWQSGFDGIWRQQALLQGS